MQRYKTVDAYIQGAEQWQEELIRLREILISTQLEETVKWGGPCYTYQGKNDVGMSAFRRTAQRRPGDFDRVDSELDSRRRGLPHPG